MAKKGDRPQAAPQKHHHDVLIVFQLGVWPDQLSVWPARVYRVPFFHRLYCVGPSCMVFPHPHPQGTASEALLALYPSARVREWVRFPFPPSLRCMARQAGPWAEERASGGLRI